ncbi:MAG: DUF5103 domain-containing protein [Ignavibacteriales bacterium]|nr:DUF5103 domain-containing protein [Ignavibacteriales bacterium]MCF8314680.1 DUF5103 domain-containing protein [Ignavibacteriales bacterium]MCF8436283.1 DUF5103 domain-containing protein [Ignavibacteriales bacterium]
MRFRSVLLIAFFYASLLFSATDIVIKSAQIFSGETDRFPLVFLGGHSTTLTIEFDVQCETMPSLCIDFWLCDADWKPYENPAINNTAANRRLNLWLEKRLISASGADYHYSEKYPNKDISFSYSGRYIAKILDSDNNYEVLRELKFFVVSENNFQITGGLKNYDYENEILVPANLNKVRLIYSEFVLPADYEIYRLAGVMIIEDRKIDNPEIVLRGDYDENSQMEWNGSNKFKFIKRNIFPGNAYRTLDIRNASRHPYPIANANLNGADMSRFYQFSRGDIHGSMRLLPDSDPNSEYTTIHFTFLPPAENLPGDIYLSGAFNDWKLSDDYRMKKSGDRYSINIELKRGIYDYQYYVSASNDGIDTGWVIYEGNFPETRKNYRLFVLYNNPGWGGYEEIIGYTIIGD